MNDHQDAQLRVLALEAALKTPNPADEVAMLTTRAIVERADAFLAFLKGEQK